jgi:uncharacterized sulfatase
VFKVRDVGFLPEGEIHARSVGTTPFDMCHDNAKYPLEKVLEMAELASGLKSVVIEKLKAGLQDDDSAVRYWAALGLLMRGRVGVDSGHDVLVRALGDSSPYVQVVAAEALATFGAKSDLDRALALLADRSDWQRNNVFVAMAALNAIGALDQHAEPLLKQLLSFTEKGPAPHARYMDYVPRLLQALK